jgi:CRISPR-associated endonuclease/helicase Cas3
LVCSFDDFFRAGSGGHVPRPYQHQLANGRWPESRVVPTGFGKTAAVLAAFLWKRAGEDSETPRRLIYCLPMRTLVEQTVEAATQWIAAARHRLDLDVSLDVRMGGAADAGRKIPAWILQPETPAIIIGTQDLLVSAALMRGYGTSRYRWPVDFALLHNDALWVFDEVQLTGATLATSAQLEAFRRRCGTGQQSRSFWMSATLDPAWLKTVDFTPAGTARAHDLSEADLAAMKQLWRARKSLRSLIAPTQSGRTKDDAKAYAQAVADMAREQTGAGETTIIFANTVTRAQAIYALLGEEPGAPERLLVHSRFRAGERAKLVRDRLRASVSPAGRIIVTTQALEAGIDITCAAMIAEIAPWSSLVQRFGRCNRNGECGERGGRVWWVDLPDSLAQPYSPVELADARLKLAGLSACGPADLAEIPPSAPPVGHVLRRRDLFDLFDTEPDLSGFDIDVSLFVREIDDTDVRLFWRPVEHGSPPSDAPNPARDELCPAPIGGAKALLDRQGVNAWRWDALAGAWRKLRKEEISPGQTIWIESASGGYRSDLGFDPAAKVSVSPVPSVATLAAAMTDDQDTSGKFAVSLKRHSIHVRDEARMLAQRLELSPDDRDAIVEAALWHDLGKAHDAFVARTGGTLPPLAKSPAITRETIRQSPRPYYRHELASALAYLSHRHWNDDASLCAYLIAAHHGKVRMRLSALSTEKKPPDKRLFARGVWEGDQLPETDLGDLVVPETELNLDLMQLGDGPHGRSWSARSYALLETLGPFHLAWLEALVRIADWRASAQEDDHGRDDL